MADIDIKHLIGNEILESNKLYGWQGASLFSQSIPDDPSYVWWQLRFNPWLAMMVYEDMEEKDSMVSSCLDTRKNGVLSKPRVILPASDKRQDKKVAAFIEETLNDYFDGNAFMQDGVRLGFEQCLWEALDSVAMGLSVGETVFESGRDRVYIKNVNFKPPHLFSFNESAFSTSALSPQNGRLRLRQGMLLDNSAESELLPEQKFLVFSYRPRYGNRWGTPQLRRVYWQSWIKRAGVKAWLKYAEKGSGSVVARYHDGAAAAEQQDALEAAQAINDEPAVAIPKKFLVEVMEMVRNIGTAHKELIDEFSNNEIARGLLGQTLTTRGSEGGGSRALGEVHENVRYEKVEADSKALMMPVNMKFIWALTLMNFGPNVPPPFWAIQYNPVEDLTQSAKRMKTLWEMNVPISKSHVYNNFQMPEPLNDDDVLPGPKTSVHTQSDEEEESLSEVSYSEGKKKVSTRNNSAQKLNSKTVRFKRLRPSMIQFSDE